MIDIDTYTSIYDLRIQQQWKYREKAKKQNKKPSARECVHRGKFCVIAVAVSKAVQSYTDYYMYFRLHIGARCVV